MTQKQLLESVLQEIKHVKTHMPNGELKLMLKEFEDMKGKGLTEAQELYGDMRMIVNYKMRTKFAMERLLPFVGLPASLG